MTKTILMTLALLSPACRIFQPPSPAFQAEQDAINQRNADARAERTYILNAGVQSYAGVMMAPQYAPPPRQMECRPSGMRPDKMVCTEY